MQVEPNEKKNKWTNLMQMLEVFEVQLWSSLKSLGEKGIYNQVYTGKYSELFN